MKLVSLAQKYGDLNSKPAGAESDEYYPSLYLEEKQIDALGVDMARVGTEMTMTSTVRISSVSESKNGNRTTSLEIVEAAFGPKEKQSDAASVLFPNG